MSIASQLTHEPSKRIALRVREQQFHITMDYLGSGIGQMGAGVVWVVHHLTGTQTPDQPVAAGHIDHDDEFAEETKKPAWVEQGAYVLPPYQRRGIYTAVLGALSQFVDAEIIADVQHTKENRAFWDKLAPEHVFPPRA